MSAIDMSLDDIIDKNSSRRGGRPAPSRTGGRPAGRAPARTTRAPTGGGRGAQFAPEHSLPYARAPGGRSRVKGVDHQSGADARRRGLKKPLLKVSSESKPNTVAGAICNVVRESRSNNPPNIMATGPPRSTRRLRRLPSRQYLLDQEQPTILVEPTFEQDIRQGSNVVFKLEKSEPISRMTEADLSQGQDRLHKLASASRSHRRRGGRAHHQGPVPVLVSIKAIAQAQAYLTDDGIGVKFAVFRDLEDPELGNTPSTYLHGHPAGRVRRGTSGILDAQCGRALRPTHGASAYHPWASYVGPVTVELSVLLSVSSVLFDIKHARCSSPSIPSPRLAGRCLWNACESGSRRAKTQNSHLGARGRRWRGMRPSGNDPVPVPGA